MTILENVHNALSECTVKGKVEIWALREGWNENDKICSSICEEMLRMRNWTFWCALSKLNLQADSLQVF
jgi:hypothetical protein